MLTAIFGGTFNPLHMGHYKILQVLNNDPKIEKILLMPDRLPPHKTAEFLIDDETRLEMCRIVAGEFSKCELCLIEFEREGKSYTIDTVKLLQNRYPSQDFAFVMGGDMLVYFDKWYKFDELMKLLPFIVFSRTATDNTEFETCVSRFSKMGMEIILKEDIIPDVSSTQVRANFEGLKELVPVSIYDFLTERGVYCG